MKQQASRIREPAADDQLPSIAVVLAVGRSHPWAGATGDEETNAGAKSLQVQVPRAALSDAAAMLLQHLRCLSSLEAGSLLVVESHVEAAAIYRHNAFAALESGRETTSCLRSSVATMAEWEADLAQYREEVADMEERRRLERPLRLAWQWRLWTSAPTPAEHVNAEVDAVLAFGLPVSTSDGPITLNLPAKAVERRSAPVRAFAAAGGVGV